MTLRNNISVSVVMSIYNEKEEWIEESIQSILNQTFTDFEFIIVNDNPERELNREILIRIQSKDKRIVIVENSQNLGLTKSLNIALKVAKGKYIARMDADDISLPERFEIQVDYMDRNASIVASGSWMEFFGDKNKKNREYRVTPSEVSNFLMIGPAISHPTLIVRKSILDLNEIKYNEKYIYTQDYEFVYQLSKVGQISNVPKVLLKYRITKNQVSCKNNYKQTELARNLRQEIITEYFGKEFVNQVINGGNRIASFFEINRLIKQNKRVDRAFYQKLCVVKYIVLISPRNIVDRIFNLICLLLNPFQEVGFSFRFYLKAVLNQLFHTYKSLL